MSSLLSLLLFLVILSLSVYSLLLLGWYSSSKYSTLGAIRSCMVSVSFEVAMALCLFLVVCSLLGTVSFMLEFTMSYSSL